SSMSVTEILVALYFGGILRHDPARPGWPERDRFIMSKGHASPGLYAALALAGYFSVDDLMTLRQIGSPLEGHPNMRRLPGVEASTGSLGQGLSIGVGTALAARLDGRPSRTYVVLGDGEIQEGQVWEAAMSAAKFKLDTLTAIVDRNLYQQSQSVANVMPSEEPLLDKWRAFGWHTLDIDGHDLAAVLAALQAAQATIGQPTVIIAHTVKGKGVSFVEADWTYHGRAIAAKDLDRALEEIG
ncbi:MAG: transketolase, partial [Chloroflexi bacterium]|nr:transketolase [Chloroflexota bacterium]